LDEDWPSAAYEDVMESMTDCAFSWPISGRFVSMKKRGGEGSRTLVVVYDISQMISPAIVSFADAHRVVREVHIAVVACGRSV
jgi:hypothetical protein